MISHILLINVSYDEAKQIAKKISLIKQWPSKKLEYKFIIEIEYIEYKLCLKVLKNSFVWLTCRNQNLVFIE